MKIFTTAALTLFACGAAYAGGFETDRAESGVKFGETFVAAAAPAVQLSGDIKPGPAAAFTADLKKEASKVSVPGLPDGGKAPVMQKRTPKQVIKDDIAAFRSIKGAKNVSRYVGETLFIGLAGAGIGLLAFGGLAPALMLGAVFTVMFLVGGPKNGLF